MSSARRYLDVVDSVASARAKAQNAHAQGLGSVFALLLSRCPHHIDHRDWQRAVEDGSRFLARWGEQADGLGWSARDLFGLHTAPANPPPNYRRLSRYDETGLIWLLRGRPVVMLTDATAVIENPSGAVAVYRKQGKRLGQMADTLDAFG